MPTFTCDLAAAVPLEHVWKHTVGSDHASIALTADWGAQLRRCDAKLGLKHEPLDSAFDAHPIIDSLLSVGMRPSSFMPETLASGSTTVFRYRGNTTPPRDYGECAVLIRGAGFTGGWL